MKIEGIERAILQVERAKFREEDVKAKLANTAYKNSTVRGVQ